MNRVSMASRNRAQPDPGSKIDLIINQLPLGGSMSARRFVAGALSFGLMLLGAGTASSQDFPTKPIRILTGSPGGSADVTSRAIGEVLAKRFEQTIVVENRPVTAADIVAKAQPDAYTLILDGGSFWLAPLMQETPYDVMRDYSPVSQA